jgi:hypothetical protein
MSNQELIERNHEPFESLEDQEKPLLKEYAAIKMLRPVFNNTSKPDKYLRIAS